MAGAVYGARVLAGLAKAARFDLFPPALDLHIRHSNMDPGNIDTAPRQILTRRVVPENVLK